MKDIIFGLKIYLGSLLIACLCLGWVYLSNHYGENRIQWREELPRFLINIVVCTSISTYISYMFHNK